jgi:hypothetical protein
MSESLRHAGGVVLSFDANGINANLIIDLLVRALFFESQDNIEVGSYNSLCNSETARIRNTGQGELWCDGTTKFVVEHWEQRHKVGTFYKSISDFASNNNSKSYLAIDGIVRTSYFTKVNGNCKAAFLDIKATYGSSWTCFYYYVTLAYGIECFVAVCSEMINYPTLVETLAGILKVNASDLMGQYVVDLMSRKYLTKGESLKDWKLFEKSKRTPGDLDWHGFVIYEAATLLDSSPSGSKISWSIPNHSDDFRIVHANAMGDVVSYRGDMSPPEICVSVGDYVAVSAGGYDHTEKPSLVFGN